ncbi:MAG: hypothetical protein OEV42_18070 [Deltaproteobacteria bacterium]|nr:hypothetical protein [Deltaproteobacteria bacterium]
MAIKFSLKDTLDGLLDSDLAKPVLVFIISAVLFFASITNGLEDFLTELLWLDAVAEANDEFLSESLSSSLKNFGAVSLAKGIVAYLSTIELGLNFGISVKAKFGDLLLPLSDLINNIWTFFGYSIASITGQITLLKFFKLFAIKLLVPIGAVATAISSFAFQGILRKYGTALIISGLFLYAAMPYTVFAAKTIFEEASITATTEMAEELGVIKVEMEDLRREKGFFGSMKERVKLMVTGGVERLTSAVVTYFGKFLVMFIIMPLFFYGLLYIFIKQILNRIQENDLDSKFDDMLLGFTKKAAGKFSFMKK